MKVFLRGALIGSLIVIFHQIFISRQGYDFYIEMVTIVGIRILMGAILGGIGFLLYHKLKKEKSI